MQRAEVRSDLSIAERVLERFTAWPAFAEVLRDLREGGVRLRLRGLTGSARSLAIAGLAEERGAPIAVLAADTTTAEEIREDIDFLLGPRSSALFPDTGGEPYAALAARGPARSIRAEVLCALAVPDRSTLPLFRDLRVVVTTPRAWMRRVPAPDALRARIRVVRAGESVEPEALVAALVAAGYEMNPLVGEYGDVSRRGGILDVYSLGREHPLRIEFDGDEISSIREFDVFTQRSIQSLKEAAILPAALINPAREHREAAAARLAAAGKADEAFLDLIRDEAAFEGSEWLAPYYGIPLVAPSAYLAAPRWTIVDDPQAVGAAIESETEEIRQAYEAAGAENRVVAAPEEIFAFAEPELPALAEADPLALADQDAPASVGHDAPALDGRSAPASERAISVRIDLGGAEDPGARHLLTRPAERFGRNLELTRSYIQRLRETCPEIHILCDTEPHRERLSELLHPTPAQLHVGSLSGGFEAPDIGLAVLTDHEIFARTRRRSAARRYTRGISLKELLAMGPGDFVVHIDHGIGVYRGLTRLLVDGQETDCMTLEYAGGDKLYIPVDQLSLVQRYSAEEGHRPQLSRLGSPSWARTKSKIKRRIRDMAEELLRTHAIRRSRPGHAFSPDTDAQAALELAFPYDETPDQLQAIAEVKADMESASPMDRLICGDVGYGKTEVAIRAAFKAVSDSKQVAILVPTTLLAEQHWETFTERLRDFPVRVEMLSRFRTPGEQKSIVRGLAAGKIDVVVGTHRLVQKDIAFRDLGLLVIDEEHRFGVAHKERLKKLRETVDVLSLTATPIPRTLHMALAGGRDMSTIMTPPRDRRPVQTEIVEFRDEVIAHALMREADRGGQSFFVHNRIETIDAMAAYLGRLVPHLRIAVAHGETREQVLEKIMHGFLHKEYDVLVSTTIIESGLDFPNVNTILMNRGDTFGLAQLYQLRGRVGRSSRKAYAYLLVPPYRSITEQAQKRLKAIEEFGDLGSGFQLAMRDLEIRGAGNLLGAEQHGFILNVGFDLYTRLLEETVRELKGQPVETKRETRVVTGLEAFLPDDYVPDSREKMALYKSIADTRDSEELDRIEEEIRDRFGMLPEPARQLLGLRRVRLLAGEAEVETATVQRRFVVLEFRRALTRGDVQRLAESSVPIEFHTPAHGRHRIRCEGFAESADPVGVALQVLRGLMAKELPFRSR